MMKSRFVNLVALVGGVAIAAIAAQRVASSIEARREKATPALEQDIEIARTRSRTVEQ